MSLPLILVLAVACLPLSWPPPPFGLSPRASGLLTLATQAAPVLVGWLVALHVVRASTNAERRARSVGLYNATRRAMPVVTLAAGAVGVLGWGWGRTATDWATVAAFGSPVPRLFPGAELLVPGPFLAAVVLGWAGNFFGERALHRTSLAVREGQAPATFWSFPGYMLFHARQLAFAPGLPVGLFVLQQSLGRTFPEAMSSAAAQVAALAVGVGVFVLLPLIVRALFGFRPLPPGPARDALDAARARLGVRVGRVMLWPTRGEMANAVVVGVLPRLRYVAVTDKLLTDLTPGELVAVYGHEAGHVRHGHVAYYAVFLPLSATVVAAATAAAVSGLAEFGVHAPGAWRTAAPWAVMGVYLFAVFGWLSRRCERQADVFGARAGSCADPECRGHDVGTRLLAGRDLTGLGVCRTGALALAAALDKVAGQNGGDQPAPRQSWRTRAWGWVRAWRHGPMSDRVEFLHRLADDPRTAVRADRSAFRARLGLAAALAGGIILAGTAAGWRTLAADFMAVDTADRSAAEALDAVPVVGGE